MSRKVAKSQESGLGDKKFAETIAIFPITQIAELYQVAEQAWGWHTTHQFSQKVTETDDKNHTEKFHIWLADLHLF